MVLGGQGCPEQGNGPCTGQMDLTKLGVFFNRITTEQTFGYMWECPLICLDRPALPGLLPQGVKPMGTEYQNVHQCTVFCLDYDFRGKYHQAEFAVSRNGGPGL